jgi:pyruvate/2-oxoglutarate dehydrogenase complex dihydrolipoamide acyltransferase (E2) component
VLTRQQIQDVCERYSGRDWWVHPDIPQDRLDAARRTWRTPPDGEPIAFVDTTVFGSGKEGLAVLHDGIVWHSGSGSGTPTAYAWRELAAVPIRAVGYGLQIGEGVLGTAGMTMKREDLAACLRELQALALAAGAERPAAYLPEGRAFPAPGEPFAEEEELRALLEVGAGDWLFVAPNVPPRKEQNARETMRVPPGEAVLALMDNTTFGSAKDGMVVTTGGIRWRNGIIGNDEGHLTWNALARARVMKSGEMIVVGEEDWIRSYTARTEGLHRLILDLQWWSRARMEPDARRNSIHAAGEVEPAAAAPDPGTPRWHLAVQGQQFGPYSARTVAAMAAAGQVNADEAFAWAEGMAGWVPLREVPELAALLAPPPAAPPPVPAAAAAAPRPPRPAPPASAEAEEPIDINNASVEELLGLPGMTRAGAERVVQERGTRGGFSDVDQVGQLLRLKPHHVERMRRMVTFGRMATSRARVVDF